MSEGRSLSEVVRGLGREFDASFARPAEPARAIELDRLQIELGGFRRSVEVRLVQGIYRGPRLTRLPGSDPELLGVAQLEGRTLAVLDLASLLGREPGEGGILVVFRDLEVAFRVAGVEKLGSGDEASGVPVLDLKRLREGLDDRLARRERSGDS